MSDDKYTLIDRAETPSVYELLDETVRRHHPSLEGAKIALLWMHDVKPDKDGRLVFGRAKKVGEVEQQFHDHDFLIFLNSAVWVELPEAARVALIDHELCHCCVDHAEDGETKLRMRKHDVEEFHEVVRRHGLWRTDVEAFVEAALGRKQAPLFEGIDGLKGVEIEISGDAVPLLEKAAGKLRRGKKAST